MAERPNYKNTVEIRYNYLKIFEFVSLFSFGRLKDQIMEHETTYIDWMVIIY